MICRKVKIVSWKSLSVGSQGAASGGVYTGHYRSCPNQTSVNLPSHQTKHAARKGYPNDKAGQTAANVFAVLSMPKVGRADSVFAETALANMAVLILVVQPAHLHRRTCATRASRALKPQPSTCNTCTCTNLPVQPVRRTRPERLTFSSCLEKMTPYLRA